MKTETCSFSGWKIYPGRGMRFVRVDSKTFLFRSSKEQAFFNQKQRATKLRWTLLYRRIHKKGVTETRTRKKRTGIKKVQRPIVGVDMEKIVQIKKENPEKAKERREAHLVELRERRAKAKASTVKTNTGTTQVKNKQNKETKQKGTGHKGR